MKTHLISIVIIIGIYSTESTGQNIIQDSEVLIQFSKILEADTHPAEDSIIEATANFLSILNCYHQPQQGEAGKLNNIDELANKYQKNYAIYDLLEKAKIQLPAEVLDTALALAQTKIATIQQQPRYNLFRLMSAKEAISPADYLSLKNTLQKYQLPTNTRSAARRIIDTPIKTLPKGGILGAELDFVTSLFQVVLNNASKEIAISFLENLLNKETPNFASLFPTTIERFANIEVNYSDSFINRLRQSFFEDLQDLKVRLPQLLLEDQYFKTLQSEPIAYNLMVLYSIIGMVQSDIPLDETIPITNRYLYQSYEDAAKEINDSIAVLHYQSEEYQQLVVLVDDFKDQLKKVYTLLVNQELIIDQSANQFGDATDKPIAKDFLSNKADLEILLNGENSDYDLFLLPSLLKGAFEGSIVDYNTLEYYDQFFGKSFSPASKRAAGLEIVKNLSGTWYQEATIVDYLQDWTNHLQQYEKAVNTWRWTVGEVQLIEEAMADLDIKRAALRQSILQEKENFWPQYLEENTTFSFPRDDSLAFSLLANIIEDFEEIDFDPFLSDIENIKSKEALLQGVQERAVLLSDTLKQQYGYVGSTPIDLLIQSNQEDSFGAIQLQIQILSNSLYQIEQQMSKLEERVEPLKKKRNNAVPILQSTELMTGLLFGLKDNANTNNWLSSNQLTQLLDNGQQEDYFLGLLQQTLGAVNSIGRVSPEALSNFTRLTLQGLEQLDAPTDTLATAENTSKKFRIATFIVNTINNMLALPLIREGQSNRNFTSLNQRYPTLQPIPETSNTVLDFMHALETKDHSRAVSSLLRIITSLNTMTNQPIGTGKRKNTITYLERYGNFIADLIDAREKEQMTDLITSITAPPGSSRIKRRRPLSVSINAYLGLNVGREVWRADNINLLEDEDFINVSPSIPIGIAFSKTFGQPNKAPSSWSLFASIIDLGGLFSYRSDADVAGESEFNLANMIKPGVQIHYNFRNSPFYLGAGLQYGPQRRQFGEESVNISTVRYFLAFGVDVPLLTLYQKFDD